MSGRQSLSKLAAHMSELLFFQIELSKNYGMTDWKDDIKNLLIRSGIENRELVFLFSDTQVRFYSLLSNFSFY